MRLTRHESRADVAHVPTFSGKLPPGFNGSLLGGVARLLEGFVDLALVQEQPERALRLAGAASALSKEHGVPLPPDEEGRLHLRLESIRQEMDESTFAAFWSGGEAMSIEVAIEYALTYAG